MSHVCDSRTAGVKEVRGTIQSGTVHEYQVTLDVGFRYLSDDEMRDWLKG
jgi:flavin-binding protein dodecin